MWIIFSGFPVGTPAPMAYYDRNRAAWVPTDDGVVVEILDITGGLAELDTTGDGLADNGAALGVTDAERQEAGFPVCSRPEPVARPGLSFYSGRRLTGLPKHHLTQKHRTSDIPENQGRR